MNDLKSKIESILFSSGRPVKLSELAKHLQSPKPEVKSALETIKRDFSPLGIRLVEHDDKYQLSTAAENAKTVADFLNAEIREKLTEAAVETLAIIVYKQPISRAEIEGIRGVNSQYILRQLTIRGMVEKTPSAEDARRYAYRTTHDFLHHLGIESVSELPDFEELTRAVSLEDTANPGPVPPEPKNATPQEQTTEENGLQVPQSG